MELNIQTLYRKKRAAIFFFEIPVCTPPPPPPPSSIPASFYKPFLTDKVPFRIPSPDKQCLFHIPSLEPCIQVTFSHRKCTVSFSHTNKLLNQENLPP